MKIREFAKKVDDILTEKIAGPVPYGWDEDKVGRIVNEEFRKIPEVQEFQKKNNLEVFMTYEPYRPVPAIYLNISLKEENPFFPVLDRPYESYFCEVGKCRRDGRLVPCRMKGLTNRAASDVLDYLDVCYNMLRSTLKFDVERIEKLFALMNKHGLSVKDLNLICEAARIVDNEKLTDKLRWDERSLTIFNKKWQDAVLVPVAGELGLDIHPVADKTIQEGA